MKKIKKEFDIKELFNKIRQFFKYKGYIEKPVTNLHEDYLLKRSVDSVGAVDCDVSGICLTKDNRRYRVFKIMFNTPNGMDRNIDQMNLEGLYQTLDALEKDFKILFPQEEKYSLNENIAFYNDRIKNCSDPKIVKQIQHQIDIMSIFNDSKYVSEILYIDVDDVERFLKLISSICTVEEYGYSDCVDLFKMLNNDIQ